MQKRTEISATYAAFKMRSFPGMPMHILTRQRKITFYTHRRGHGMRGYRHQTDRPTALTCPQQRKCGEFWKERCDDNDPVLLHPRRWDKITPQNLHHLVSLWNDFEALWEGTAALQSGKSFTVPAHCSPVIHAFISPQFFFLNGTSRLSLNTEKSRTGGDGFHSLWAEAKFRKAGEISLLCFIVLNSAEERKWDGNFEMSYCIWMGWFSTFNQIHTPL